MSPRLPGELGRQTNLVSRYGGSVFDHVLVSIGGDRARLFIPQGIVPGSPRVPVLWLYHASNSSHDALIGGFRAMGERAVDLGLVAICQNLGGSLYTSPTAKKHHVNGYRYLAGLYGIDRNFLRGTSHGGAMASEVVATGVMPNVVGAYLVNSVYDIERLYLSGTDESRRRVGTAFGNDIGLIRAHNPARHDGSAWAGARLRVVFSQPDSSDSIVPPDEHGKSLIAVARPYAAEASVRTHASGHTTPSFADADNQETIARWLDETEEAPTVPAPIASWCFTESAAPFAADVAGAPALQQGTDSTAVRTSTPFGGGIQLNGRTDYLRVPQASVTKLNIGATTNEVTIAAWVLSTDTTNAMIAGCWEESRSDPRRSYALFNDLPMYGGDNMVCMEVSKLGDATPGYPFSVDYAAEPRTMTRGVWQFHVGTYDGSVAKAYLDGAMTAYPAYTDPTGASYSKNPYSYPDGLNATPVDFMVGGVVRDGSVINLHAGTIAKLRVWNVALSAAHIRALYDSEATALA